MSDLDRARIEELLRALDRAQARLRSVRRERGWTQAQLAERSGVSRDRVNRLERGSRRVDLAAIVRDHEAAP